MDLNRRDLTLDLARVFSVLLVVVVHLLMVGVGTSPDGGLVISRPLELQPWFDPVTWVGQIMPLFFVVGGFASITAWRSLTARGGTSAEFVTSRLLRLARPTFPLFVFYVVVLGAATAIGVDADLVHSVALGAGSPLWFIAAYGIGQALVPWLAAAHARAPKTTVGILLAGAIAVDAARSATGVTQIGYLNMFFVWLLVQQLGFWYADGWFDRRRAWQLVAAVVASYVVLLPLTLVGPYDTDMLTNLNPPTLPLVVLGFAQACLLRLLRAPLRRLMATRAAQATVFVIGSRLMTIYLWHLPLIIIAAGVGLLIPGASPEPGSAAWWWSRIPLYVVILAALFALSFLVGRWERPRPSDGIPPGPIVVIATVLVVGPPFAEIEWFLSLPLAIAGTLCFGAAILLLTRWPVRTPAARRLEPEVAAEISAEV